jgi:hypothetical protein
MLFLILENGHSQKQAPSGTPENTASPVTQHAGLTPENTGAGGGGRMRRASRVSSSVRWVELVLTA